MCAEDENGATRVLAAANFHKVKTLLAAIHFAAE
jgi:hypothetical protein